MFQILRIPKFLLGYISIVLWIIWTGIHYIFHLSKYKKCFNVPTKITSILSLHRTKYSSPIYELERATSRSQTIACSVQYFRLVSFAPPSVDGATTAISNTRERIVNVNNVGETHGYLDNHATEKVGIEQNRTPPSINAALPNV